MEPGALPVLAGQDADPDQPAGRCSSARRSTTCTCGRWARRSAAAPPSCPARVPVATDLITIGADTIIRRDSLVHRLPRGGRRRSRPARCTSATTCSSARRPCSTSTPRSATARQLGPHLVAAHRAAHPGRRALARRAGRAAPRRLPGGPGGPRGAAGGASSTACCSCCSRWCVAPGARRRAGRTGRRHVPGRDRRARPTGSPRSAPPTLLPVDGRDHRWCCSSSGCSARWPR